MKILIYLAAGIAIGLLIAPEKGAEMRKKLMSNFDDSAGNVKDFFGDAASDLKAKGKHVSADAEDAAEKAF